MHSTQCRRTQYARPRSPSGQSPSLRQGVPRGVGLHCQAANAIPKQAKILLTRMATSFEDAAASGLLQ